MAFQLLGQQERPKGDQVYVVKLYFDADTNTQKHEYVLNGEVLYYMEYEMFLVEEPDKDIDLSAIVEGFDNWYDQFGPEWRPEAFYLA